MLSLKVKLTPFYRLKTNVAALLYKPCAGLCFMVAVKLDKMLLFFFQDVCLTVTYPNKTKVSRFVKDAAIFDSSYLFSHFS